MDEKWNLKRIFINKLLIDSTNHWLWICYRHRDHNSIWFVCSFCSFEKVLTWIWSITITEFSSSLMMKTEQNHFWREQNTVRVWMLKHVLSIQHIWNQEHVVNKTKNIFFYISNLWNADFITMIGDYHIDRMHNSICYVIPMRWTSKVISIMKKKCILWFHQSRGFSSFFRSMISFVHLVNHNAFHYLQFRHFIPMIVCDNPY